MSPKVSGTVAELIGISVTTVLIIVATVILYIVSEKTKVTAVSETLVERVDPVPPDYTPYVTPINCLPSGTSNSELISCDTQDACYACTETPGDAKMNCSVVSNNSGILNSEGKFDDPLVVSVNINSPEACSGHGTMQDGVCKCDGDLEAGDTVIYTGENCATQKIYIDKPGNYCLPAYMNACDASTSDLVLGGF